MIEIKIALIENNKISISFAYNSSLIIKIKQIEGRIWNQQKKYWEIPYSRESLEKIEKLFDEYPYKISNSIYLIDLQKELKMRGFSKNTIDSYYYYNKKLLDFTDKKPDNIEQNDIKEYLYMLAASGKYSNSTINLAINAIKFFYLKIMKRMFCYEIIRPKYEKRLPEVMSKFEIKNLVDILKNIKHKLIILLTYSSGLRVSETSNLRKSDIDEKRKLVFIKSSKGRKDRYSILSNKIFPLLEEYCKIYWPVIWLFEGQIKSRHISVRTIQKIFDKACKKANIAKNVTVHSLRHSFATHLLEDGVSLRFIQELLGHKSSKTTEIYTHVAKSKIENIKNPLDDILF